MVAFFYQWQSRLVSMIRSERGIGVAFMAALSEAFRLRLCLKQRTDIVSRAASGVATLRLVAR
jgi:hypothetical protein